MSTSPKVARFADLPGEVRELIWLQCLPRRIFELDNLRHPEYIWGDEYPMDDFDRFLRAPPCQMWTTRRLNRRLPLISAVCRESRNLVFRIRMEQSSAMWLRRKEQLSEHMQELFTDLLEPDDTGFEPWCDFRRSEPHCYFEDEMMQGSAEDPLGEVVEMASFFDSRTVSFDFTLCQKGEGNPVPDDPEPIPSDHPRRLLPPGRLSTGGFGRPNLQLAVDQDTQALKKRDNWQVVMGTVVIHCAASRASGAGFFGILGDAPIEIIDITDHDRVQALMWLAKTCEEETSTSSRQNLDDILCVPTDPDLARRRLEHLLWHNGFNPRLYKRIHPALMFRLCTHACHLHDKNNHDSQERCGISCDLT